MSGGSIAVAFWVSHEVLVLSSKESPGRPTNTTDLAANGCFKQSCKAPVNLCFFQSPFWNQVPQVLSEILNDSDSDHLGQSLWCHIHNESTLITHQSKSERTSPLCEPLLRRSVLVMEKMDPITVGKCAFQSQDLSLLLVPVAFHGFVCSHCLNIQREGLCTPQVPQSASNCSLATKQQQSNWIYTLPDTIYPKNKCPLQSLWSLLFSAVSTDKKLVISATSVTLYILNIKFNQPGPRKLFNLKGALQKAFPSKSYCS